MGIRRKIFKPTSKGSRKFKRRIVLIRSVVGTPTERVYIVFVGVGLLSCLLSAVVQQASPLLTLPSFCPPPFLPANGQAVGVWRPAGQP